MNAYDLEHACTGHPLMSKEAWQKVYADAWTRHYTDEHVETILRRAAASGLRLNKLRHLLTVFAGSARIEGVHPLQFGIFRRKVRTQRRAGMPILNPLVFYPWRVADTVRAAVLWARLLWRHYRIMARVRADRASAGYCDEALRAPAGEAEADHLAQIFADKIPHTHGAPVRAAAPPVAAAV